jgi:hypothetical protein
MISAQLAAMSDRLEHLERLGERNDLILMLREPGSTAAADAYEGLRKQLVASVTDRLVHLKQLVQMDAALRDGATIEVVRGLVEGWVDEAGLERVWSVDHPQRSLLFDVVGADEGQTEVLEPAYIDSNSGRVIRQGRLGRLSPALQQQAVAADVPSASHGAEVPHGSPVQRSMSPELDSTVEPEQGVAQ